MPLESATTIEELNSSYPNSSDPIAQSDDHHRQNKAVLKNIFRGEAGQGFAIPIDATEAELNFLVGLTGLVQGQIDALVAAAALHVHKDGSTPFTASQAGVAATADAHLVRANDLATSALGGTMKARYVSATKTLYLSNDDAIDP